MGIWKVCDAARPLTPRAKTAPPVGPLPGGEGLRGQRPLTPRMSTCVGPLPQGEELRRAAVALIFMIVASAVFSGEAPKPQRKEVMEYGNFLSTSVLESKRLKRAKGVTAEPPIIATKGIVIKLGGGQAAVCFDTDTLTMAAGWSGGFLNFNDTMLVNHKGIDNCTPDGKVAFRTKGLSWSATGSFVDTRPMKVGPLPKATAHYKGLYVFGDSVTLSYTVADRDVLESPGYRSEGGHHTFQRTFRVEKSTVPLALKICEINGAKATATPTGGVLEGTSTLVVDSALLPAGSKFLASESAIVLVIPALTEAANFRIEIYDSEASAEAESEIYVRSLRFLRDLKETCKGGPAHWKPLETVGKVAADEKAYVVDTVTLPDGNPWNSWMRTTAFDFFDDGRAAIATLNGDVWIVSGINAGLEKLTWRRFATGLYEPLGLKIVDGLVHVTGRDQITRLHDLNGDGEADFYENFFNGTAAHHVYHCFAMDLQTDSKGNIYFARCGRSAGPDYPDHGVLIKVAKDGASSEIVATGLRTANGLTIGPGDEILIGDNEGEWTPSSKLSVVKPGDFLGHMLQHHRPAPPTDYVRPMCWIPHGFDTSSGGQAWAGGNKWGPLNGHYVHTSFGKSLLMVVLKESSDGTLQGGTYALPLNFNTGIMRPRFNPVDGQLYVCGVGGGWQTNGTRDGGFQRVRYTGKPAHLPVALRVRKNGVEIEFSDSLDKPNAEDLENYSVEQWNYKWTQAYGSPEFSVAEPGKKAHDPMAVSAAKMLDAKTLLLEMPDLKPVMQMQVRFKLKGADGAPVNATIYNTINAVPER